MIKWAILGSVSGVLAGLTSTVFIVTLYWVTSIRLSSPFFVLLLPLAGFLIGWINYRFIGSTIRGSNLILDEIQSNRQPISLFTTPAIFLGTCLTHLCGGSAGWEGPSMQISMSLSDLMWHRFNLTQEDRRLILMASISGGFGSVFGAPTAGFLFGLERQGIGGVWYAALIPCLTASIIGTLVTKTITGILGLSYIQYPAIVSLEPDAVLFLKVIVASLVFGLTSLLFITLIDYIRHSTKFQFGWSPVRFALGGFLVIVLTFIFRTQDYQGLSTSLITNSLSGLDVASSTFLLKIIFTIVTLGAGYLGGEVTPTLVIGSTLGYTLGRLLGVDPGFMAAIGLIALFTGVTKAPLSGIMLGIELFHGNSVAYMGIGCFVAFLVSGQRGTYGLQGFRYLISQMMGSSTENEEVVITSIREQPEWFPFLPRLTGLSIQRPVGAVMSQIQIMCRPNTPISSLKTFLLEKGVDAVVVTDKDRVIGTITIDELFRRGGIAMQMQLSDELTPDERGTSVEALRDRYASNIATASAISVSNTTKLQDVLHVMVEHKSKYISVVNRSDQFVGLITWANLLHEFLPSDAAPIWEIENQMLLSEDDEYLRQFLSREVTAIAPDTGLDQILQLMVNSGTQCIVVVDGSKHPLGVITEDDLLTHIQFAPKSSFFNQILALLYKSPADLLTVTNINQQASTVMTTPIVTVQRGTAPRDVLRLMLEHRMKYIPIVNHEGQLVGLVGQRSLIRKLLSSTR